MQASVYVSLPMTVRVVQDQGHVVLSRQPLPNPPPHPPDTDAHSCHIAGKMGCCRFFLNLLLLSSQLAKLCCKL